jgi:tRNA A-37 threonylcarbamoyl transferase component Bud32
MKPQTPPIAPPRKSTLSISTSKGKLDGPPRVELDFSETNAPLEQVIKSLSSTRITKSIDVDVVKSRSIQHVGQLETLSRGKLTSDALNSGDQAGHFDINLNAQAEFADINANGQEENTDINSTTIQIQVKQAKNISTSQLISMSLSRSEVIQVPAPNTKQDSSSTVVEGPIDFPLDPQTTIDIENPPSSTHLPLKRKQIGKWILGITIGEGSSGKVKLAHHIETKESCVVKAVRRPKLTSFQKSNPAMLAKIYKRELYMIREACLGIILDHTNIVKLHSAVLGENHFYCFFEHIVGIDLVDYISNAGKIDELHARKIFRQVISAVEYAHRNYIVHRDIKLENIRYNPDSGVVKILDFGFASFYAPGQALKTNCGSPW